MKKNKTAVDFLWIKTSNGEHLTPEDFEQSKQMEKEQIEQAYYNGRDDGCPNGIVGGRKAEQYYNETYGK